MAREFKVVKIDVGRLDRNLGIAAAYGNPIKKGIPAAGVLSADNQVLYATRAGELPGRRLAGPGQAAQGLRQRGPPHGPGGSGGPGQAGNRDADRRCAPGPAGHRCGRPQRFSTRRATIRNGTCSPTCTGGRIRSAQRLVTSNFFSSWLRLCVWLKEHPVFSANSTNSCRYAYGTEGKQTLSEIRRAFDRGAAVKDTPGRAVGFPILRASTERASDHALESCLCRGSLLCLASTAFHSTSAC
jgi:hypothetical protein